MKTQDLNADAILATNIEETQTERQKAFDQIVTLCAEHGFKPWEIREALTSPKHKFDEIYKNNIWKDGESKSGIGSELKYTKQLREELPKLIAKYKISSIVDAPCGDFHWMQHVLQEVDVQYTGMDIVGAMIADNNARYKTAGIQFEMADICSDKLPNSDLLIVRDCLFHLSFHDINAFLKNIKKTDYKYLLTTTHLVEDQPIENLDIVTSGFRSIDLYTAPFNFDKSAQLAAIDDHVRKRPRQMVLFKKADVPEQLVN